MRTQESQLGVAAEATPAAASTAAGTTIKGGALRTADALMVDALLVGGTGGVLDVYLQRKLAADTWVDWIHFPQVSAGATVRYSCAITGKGSSIVAVGGGSDAAPGVALAANTAVDVIPGGDVRLVYVAGAGTSAAGAATVTITPYNEQR